MSVAGYFVKRPRAEIEADERGANQPIEGKDYLTPQEAALCLDRIRLAKATAGQHRYATSQDLDPVLRFHLRLD